MVRAWLAAAILLALAACSRDGALGPFAESQVPPNLTPRFYPPEGLAWGFVGTGDNPVQRYGVASTPRVPVAQVVIVPGYGESAEMWFETASNLIARGCTVWILDRAGQGGSGRYVAPRDLGFVPSFDADVSGLRALVRVVIRPEPDMPLIVLAHDDGAVVALNAVRTGLTVDGLVVSSPRLAEPAAAKPLLGMVRRADAPPAGWKPWTREMEDDRRAGRTHDPWRGRIGQAWRTANPDLRMAGPSLGWTKAFEAASRSAETGAAQVRARVLMLAPTARAAALCARLPACQAEAIPGARPALHLEADAWRAPWLRAVGGFVDARIETRAREALSGHGL